MSQEELIEKTFRVPAPARLSLSNIRGSIEIQPGDDDIVNVTAVKHLGTGNPDRTEIEIRQVEDGSVSVETRFPEAGFKLFGWRQPCKVDYIVRVPHACSVKMSGVSCTASIRGLQGVFDLGTVSGPLSMADLTGRLRASGVSGSISGVRLSGPIQLENVSGSAELMESQLSVVVGSTVSGRIVLETPLAEGPYRFKTVSGAVRLIVPPETGCIVEGSGVSGRLKTSLPTTHSRRSGGHWCVELHGGGPEIRFSSVSGDLWLVPPDGAAPVASPLVGGTVAGSQDVAGVTPSVPSTAEDRLHILDRISRGELSVEDGLAALDN